MRLSLENVIPLRSFSELSSRSSGEMPPAKDAEAEGAEEVAEAEVALEEAEEGEEAEEAEISVVEDLPSGGVDPLYGDTA